MQVNPDNVVPHSNELEESVIGSLITYPVSLIDLLPVLKPEVFYNTKHQVICQAILNLVNKEAPIDIVTVVTELRAMHKLDDIGGPMYLSRLTNILPTSTKVNYHYRVLMELFFRRKMVDISYTTVKKAHDLGEDVFDLYESLSLQLQEIEVHVGAGSSIDSKEIYKLTTEMIENKNEEKRFFPINDPGIDNILGIAPGNLVNFSGKSGSGKTSLIVHLARVLLENYRNVSICWYSMEDEPQKIMMNFLSPRMFLTNSQLMGRNYKMTEAEKAIFLEYAKRFSNNDIEFVHQPSFISHIKVHFQRFCAKRPNNFCVLIIDNLMLLKDNHHQRFKAKSYEVDDHIAGQLQATFTSTKKDHMVNVWYVHHLTKEQLSKTNAIEGYRPTEDNIRGSTRLRDIATQGIMINRPGEFPDLVKQYAKTPLEAAIQNLMVCEVYKNRNGRTGFFRYFVDLGYKIFYPF